MDISKISIDARIFSPAAPFAGATISIMPPKIFPPIIID
jgi:hypothetical protein